MSRTDKIGKVELAASGSTVDIVSIPCRFHASRYDLLDQLFIPLLTSAQQANDLMGLRVGDNKSALQAASFLAGELLRDNSFAPVRTMGSSARHAYLIDMVANTFQAETNVFSKVGEKSSMFRLQVAGAIRGDKFVVADSITGLTLFSFTRFEAEKPDFFQRDFPFLANEARKDPSLFAGGKETLVHGVIDLMVGVPVAGENVTVRIQKSANSSTVEVRHHPTNAVVMSLPLGVLSNISKLVETVSLHLATNPTAIPKEGPPPAAEAGPPPQQPPLEPASATDAAEAGEAAHAPSQST